MRLTLSPMSRLFLLLCSLSFLSPSALSQTLFQGLEQCYELQATVSDGHTPLWLQSNRYGLSSVQDNNGYVRAGICRPLAVDSLSRWGVGYGVDVAAAWGNTSSVILQQCFAEVRYLHGVLTVGQKQQPLSLRNAWLSSGAQALGINARPVPALRLEVPDYYDIPGTHRWLGFRGHISYGWTTDGNWQEEWTRGETKYAQDVMLHTKAGYLRVGPDDEQHPFVLELGLEMACQFGGTMYHTSYGTLQGQSDARAWLNALLARGGDEDADAYANVAGNHLGSWVARATYHWSAVSAALYFDHYFEDHSSMFLLDYDGYGQGAAWAQRAANRYLMYPLRDMQLGLELQMHCCPWLQSLVLEYLDTRYQSGPIYHDHNPGIGDHIGGADAYYNHYLYHGWSHWGQVMGSPLYRSPLYNTDQTLTVQDNRFYAWHCGMMGAVGALGYRVLLSWQQGYGTYEYPLLRPARNLSWLAEATYTPSADGWLGGCALRVAVGMDHGALLGNNLGAQLSVIYHIQPKSPRR